MYKKLKIELIGSNITYGQDSVSVNCNFKLLDPSQMVDQHMPHEEGEKEPKMREMGNYNVVVEFPVGSEPTKTEILDAVNDLDGIVSTY